GLAVPHRDERLPRRARQAPADGDPRRGGAVAAALPRLAARGHAGERGRPRGRRGRQGDDRADVPHRDPALGAVAARGVHPPRRPGLLGQGDRRAAGDDGRLGELRASARPRRPARAPARAARRVAARPGAVGRRAGAARPLRRGERAGRHRGLRGRRARRRPLLDAAPARRLGGARRGHRGLGGGRLRLGCVRLAALRGHAGQPAARGRVLRPEARRRRAPAARHGRPAHRGRPGPGDRHVRREPVRALRPAREPSRL
ncbi:MAG: RNA polymerase sigma factor RpoE, partial [uncultured Solirubrobacteraceae bacterium]